MWTNDYCKKNTVFVGPLKYSGTLFEIHDERQDTMQAAFLKSSALTQQYIVLNDSYIHTQEGLLLYKMSGVQTD